MSVSNDKNIRATKTPSLAFHIHVHSCFPCLHSFIYTVANNACLLCLQPTVLRSPDLTPPPSSSSSSSSSSSPRPRILVPPALEKPSPTHALYLVNATDRSIWSADLRGCYCRKIWDPRSAFINPDSECLLFYPQSFSLTFYCYIHRRGDKKGHLR